jgi:hypothetical protein
VDEGLARPEYSLRMIGILSLAAVGPAFADEPCEPRMVERGLASLEAVQEAPARVAMASAVITRSCPDAPRAFTRIAGLAPEQRVALDFALVTQAPEAWGAVCKGSEGLQIVADLSALDAETQRAHLWTACGLEATGFMDEAEWTAAKGLRFAPFIGAEVLSGLPDGTRRTLARALAGVVEKAEQGEPAN